MYGMTLVYVNHLVESGKGYLWDDLMKVTKLFIEANQEQNSQNGETFNGKCFTH